MAKNSTKWLKFGPNTLIFDIFKLEMSQNYVESHTDCPETIFQNPKFLTCAKWPKTAILGIKSCALIYWPKLGQNGPHHHFQRHFYCPYAKNQRGFIFFFFDPYF